MPIKWTAPEAIQYLKFSTMSDIWSFGVTIWEMWSQGMIPYAEMTNKEVLEAIPKGYRLEKPVDCPVEVYDLMKECWSKEPRERPTWKVIYQKLSKMSREL